jgi:hypothetical protein
MFPRDSRYQYHAEPDRKDDDAAPQVRLEKDERKEHERVRSGDKNVTEVFDFDMSAARNLPQPIILRPAGILPISSTFAENPGESFAPFETHDKALEPNASQPKLLLQA